MMSKKKNNKIMIGDKVINEKSPVFIIAEACDNHMGSLETAKKMALVAKVAGADAVKFQHHLPDEEMLKDVPMSDNFDEPLYEFLKKHALSFDQHKELMKYCRDIGITYMCTPFSYKAAEQLHKAGLGVFKIGSGEFMDFPYLKKIAKWGKPMILSTGMCSLDEIHETYDFLKEQGAKFIFMNCTSEYPPVYEDINLGVIDEMKKRFKIPIGHSDHTPDIYTSFAAVAKGAKVIEKHFILDKTIRGPDQMVSISPYELSLLVEGIRKIEKALGKKKKVHPKEKAIREWAYRSVVTIKDIKKGEVFNEDNIWTKRPGTGISAKEFFGILGKKAKKNLKKGRLLKWEDIE